MGKEAFSELDEMQGAHKDATAAYMEIREDRGFVGNAADRQL